MFKNPPIAYAKAKPAPKPSVSRREGARPSHGLAARHEALFLRLTALHRDVTALATRRGRGGLNETVRIMAEGLVAECVPFLERRVARIGPPASDGFPRPDASANNNPRLADLG